MAKQFVDEPEDKERDSILHVNFDMFIPIS